GADAHPSRGDAVPRHPALLGRTMAPIPILQPRSEGEVHEAVRWALADRTPLELVGGSTKRAIGRPVAAGATLDLSRLSGITLYEPDELVLACGAGTTLAEVTAKLDDRRQHLAFEPPDLG